VYASGPPEDGADQLGIRDDLLHHQFRVGLMPGLGVGRHPAVPAPFLIYRFQAGSSALHHQRWSGKNTGPRTIRTKIMLDNIPRISRLLQRLKRGV